MAAEFRPLLRSPGNGSRCVLIAEAEPPFDRLRRPHPVVRDRDITPGGVRLRDSVPAVVYAVTSSSSGSGTSSGFLEKLRMKSAALLACADARRR